MISLYLFMFVAGRPQYCYLWCTTVRELFKVCHLCIISHLSVERTVLCTMCSVYRIHIHMNMLRRRKH
jgi:hypothetical protein